MGSNPTSSDVLMSIMFRYLCFFFCLALSAAGFADEKPIVLTTIAPYTYLVDRLAEGAVTVQTLVPPNANAHLFEPSPKDVEKLEKAKLWLRVGEGFETRLLAALKGHASDLQIIELWSTLPLIRNAHSTCSSGFDRHLWVSPRMLRRQVPLIASALKLLTPLHAAAIDERMHRLMEELEAKDKAFACALSAKKGQTLLTAHPSFSYFCRDYDLLQLSIEAEGKDPLPKHLDALLAKSKKGVIPRLFIQPQFPARGAKQVAENLKLQIYTIDPYAYNFLSNLDAFVQTLKEAD